MAQNGNHLQLDCHRPVILWSHCEEILNVDIILARLKI
jgi:hypothetical protein